MQVFFSGTLNDPISSGQLYVAGISFTTALEQKEKAFIMV